jgi:folate-binding Fe-S cluster repair protein YgfZ
MRQRSLIWGMRRILYRFTLDPVVPDHLDELKKINAEYLSHFKAFAARSQESSDISYELQALKGKRSRAASAQRTRLKERQTQITFDLEKSKATMFRAAKILDSLGPKDQDQVRALSLGVIKDLESYRKHQTILRERFGLY